jgi:phosphopantothenoylcysteine decarboxylase / phosphopantothenate---cysteine ligase
VKPLETGRMCRVARVLLGVTGGIAAYKACELVRLFLREGHEIVPLVTEEADRFVRRETFFALARRSPDDDLYAHLTRADLLVVAPLTANTLAKLAHGLADNLVTEAALAHRGPVLVAPAMNPRMWAHPATRANAALLRDRGVELVGPDEGDTAEGEVGVGRMAEPDEIFRRARELLGETGTMAGRHVLVSAGGTREPIDAVRFVGNRASGRMGVALAAEARRRGAQVTLLAANLSIPAPVGVDVVETPTAQSMLDAALARADADLVLMAAAPADYRPAEVRADKRPKDDEPWTVELEPTTDILRTLGERRSNGQVLVSFAADHGERGLERARQKLARKRADLVVYNDVSQEGIGFDADENEVVLISAGDERHVTRAPKPDIAAAIVDAAEQLLKERGAGS